MKIPFHALFLLVALFGGCRERGKVFYEGSSGYTYNGVALELPNNGKGLYDASQTQLYYKWEGKELTIQDLGDGTVSVTTPKTSDQVFSKSIVIVIDSDGGITTRKPEDSDKIQMPNKSEMATPRKPSD